MDAPPGETEGAVVKPVQLFVVCMGSCLTDLVVVVSLFMRKPFE